MTEDSNTQQDRWPPVRHPAPKWWLLTKSENYGAELLLTDCGNEQALPVFSGEGEAKMFVWLRGALEDGWQVRETSAGELVSILYGPAREWGGWR